MSKNFPGTALDILGPSTHSEQKKETLHLCLLSQICYCLYLCLSIYLFRLFHFNITSRRCGLADLNLVRTSSVVGN